MNRCRLRRRVDARRSLFTLKTPSEFQLTVKNSRFICLAKRVENVDQALSLLRRKKDPKATHNCFAYRIGTEERSSDDGEVAGTAGRQILSAIRQSKLDQVMVIVTRFYGGIKLGTGGLSRAYFQTASKCLELGNCFEITNNKKMFVLISVSSVGRLRHMLNQFEDTKILSEKYEDDTVAIEAQIQEKDAFTFEESFITQFSREDEGSIKIADI